MAPELAKDPKGTDKIDVFSYSILSYEIFVGRKAYTGIQGVELLIKVSNEGLRPDLTALKKIDCPEKLIDLIKKCWNQLPNERPSFEQILIVLKSLR